jgi:hypothetical protein
MKHIYKHPVGHEMFLERGSLTMTNAEWDESVSVPVSQNGLREMGEYLIALSKCEHTAADYDEQAGITIANALLRELLDNNHRVVRSAHIESSIRKLLTIKHHECAIHGFAKAMVNVIEVGLKNMPRDAE